MEQTLILVDSADNGVGYAPWTECHRGDGKVHRAIAIVLFDMNGNVLLQQRKSRLWDGYWDITAATHPLHADGHDESYQQAAERCLQNEWRTTATVTPAFPIVYFERYGDLCENEYCLVLLGQHDGGIALNPDYGYDLRHAAVDGLVADLRARQESYTPWARHVVEALSARGPAATLGSAQGQPPTR